MVTVSVRFSRVVKGHVTPSFLSLLLAAGEAGQPGHLQRARPFQERRRQGRGGGRRGRGQRHRGRGGPFGPGRHHPAPATAASAQAPHRKDQLP